MREFKAMAIAALLPFAVAFPLSSGLADADRKSGTMADNPEESLQSLKEIHAAHEHGHNFEAMEQLSPEDLARVMEFLVDTGLVVPAMDPARGRKIFLEKGCVACHSINGVGGEIGPSLDAADMPSPMNTFEFSARMWRGAEAMVALQSDMLGGLINLGGQDLADIVAFAHSEEEQKKLRLEDVPEKFRKLFEE